MKENNSIVQSRTSTANTVVYCILYRSAFIQSRFAVDYLSLAMHSHWFALFLTVRAAVSGL